MKVIVAGGRYYSDKNHVFSVLDNILGLSGIKIDRIVSGGAKGADSLGEQWADNKKIPVKRFSANWKLYGKSAGPIRNEEMAKYAEAVILFPGGRGTDDMRKNAIKYGLTILYDEKER